MYKLIIIETHGVTITEGTQIHIHAAFNQISPFNESLVAAYMYTGDGVLLKAVVGRFTGVWQQ